MHGKTINMTCISGKKSHMGGSHRPIRKYKNLQLKDGAFAYFLRYVVDYYLCITKGFEQRCLNIKIYTMTLDETMTLVRIFQEKNVLLFIGKTKTSFN